MNFIASVFREIYGLFVDDGSFALQLVGLIAVAVLAVKFTGSAGLWVGALLLVGCLAILALSLRGALRR